MKANLAGASRRPLRVMTLSALAFALIIGWVALGPGVRNALATSVVDFSQCANDAFPSTALDCPGDWINGILIASKSHYAEDDVVPQRFVVDMTTTGIHSITFRYETRK